MNFRIDNYCDNKINVEAITKTDLNTVNGGSLSEAVVSNPGVMTMNATDVNKSGIMALDGVGNFEDIKEKAGAIKNSLEVIKDTMETGHVVELDKDGININDTRLEEIVTVVERMQIKLATYCDDFNVTAMGISTEEIKATMGNSIAAYKAAGTLDSGAKAFLVNNKLEPTIDNVYKAMYSGAKNSVNKMSDSTFEELKPQVETVIKEAGIEINDKSYNDSRLLIENDIELTAENLSYYTVLDNLKIPEDEIIIDRIKAALLEGKNAGATPVTGKKQPFEEAVFAINVLSNMTANDIMILSKMDSKTINVLSDIEDNKVGKADFNADFNADGYIHTYRQLQEIRLMMTIESGRFLEKNGISINTTEISELVDRLKKYELDRINSRIDNPEEQIKMVQMDEINQVMVAFDSLRVVSVNTLGAVVTEECVSVNILNKRAVREASDSYEALRTEIRTDLGDSLNKAIKSSTDDILSGMGYEDNEENRRAVRILAYNSIQMTEDNIDKIKDLYVSVNNLFDKMTPEKALKLIRKGINPLDKDVRELADNIDEFDSEDNTEKYSEFLYKLEKKKDITPEEREKYMAIYSLVNRFKKDGLNSLGSLMKQGLELTMGNLLSSYMTRRTGEISLEADITTGFAEFEEGFTNKISYYKHLFSQIHNKAMPEVISDISEGEEIEEMSIEKFIKEVKESESYSVNEAIFENLEEAAGADAEVYRLISEYDIPASINNILAMKEILSESRKNTGRFFNKAIDVKEDMKDENSLRSVYKNLLKETEEGLLESKSYLDIKSLRTINTGFRIMNRMSERSNYFIPCSQNGKEIMINLKIVDGNKERGKFQIQFESETYGRVSIEGKVNKQSVTAIFVCDSRNGNERIKEKFEDIKKDVMELGYDEVNCYANISEEFPYVLSGKNSRTETERIFELSKIFIVNFTN